MKTYVLVAAAVLTLGLAGCSSYQGGTRDDRETMSGQVRQPTKPMENNQPRRVFPDPDPTP